MTKGVSKAAAGTAWLATKGPSCGPEGPRQCPRERKSKSPAPLNVQEDSFLKGKRPGLPPTKGTEKTQRATDVPGQDVVEEGRQRADTPLQEGQGGEHPRRGGKAGTAGPDPLVFDSTNPVCGHDHTEGHTEVAEAGQGHRRMLSPTGRSLRCCCITRSWRLIQSPADH